MNILKTYITEQPHRQQLVWIQKWTFNRDCLALGCWSPKTCKSGFQIFNIILLDLSAAFDTADPPVNPIGKGPLRNHTPVVWVVPLIPLFQQGSSSAGSEPEPSFKPVLCLSTPKAQAQNQEKRSVQAWLLQCSLGRSSSQFYQTFTINPDRGRKIHF